MRKILILTAAVSLFVGGTALAGLNPEFPMLPAADAYGLTDIANNYASAMCVDCHSRIPQVSGGTHFVTATANSDTRSSGGWASGTYTIANNRNTTEAGGYFQYKVASDWGVGLYSKYGNATGSAASLRSVIVPGTAVDVGDAVAGTEPVDTVAADYWTSIEGPAAPGAGLDIICESCHNVLNNVAGGNNLLGGVSDSPTWDVDDATEATICVGCHGFMYTADQLNNPALPSAHGDANWNDVRNSTGVAARGNAESHYIQGLEYTMNHHVMTGDMINGGVGGKITEGYAWRDLTAYAGINAVMNEDNTLGQYPVNGVWAADKEKTSTGGFNCLNCHTAGHGMQGGVVQAPASAGASILIDVIGDIATGGDGDATTVIERLGENTRDWMSIADTGYCNNCHHLPGGAAIP